MRIFLFPMLLAFLPLSLHAQLSEILKDPNIIWAATFETEHDFRLTSKRETSKIQLKKFTSAESGCVDFNNENWLAQWILKGMSDGKYQAYADPDLSVLVARTTLLNKISTTDTVIVFYPDTYEEVVKVIRNDINPADIKSFRTQQVIFFDKKMGGFGTRLLALAPMVSLTNQEGKVVGSMPLAWLAMESGIAGNLSVKDPDIIWSSLLIDEANCLEISKLNVKKDDKKKTFAEQLFQEALGMKHPVEKSSGYGCGTLLTKKDIENMTAAIDTVVTFNPTTFEESIQIIRNDLNPADIKKVWLAQEWYFDTRRNLLLNRLKALAPTISVTDTNGKVKYTKAMYFLHF